MKEDFQVFLNLASENALETILKNPNAYSLLNDIDHAWKVLGFSPTAHRDSPLAVMLAMNGHSVFRACITNALSGHTAPVYPLLRNALENCLYAFRIAKNPNLEGIWTNRHENKDSRQNCVKEFNASRAIKELREIDPNLGNLAEELYEAAIDYGAHPNISGLLENLSFRDKEENIQAELAYIKNSSEKTDRALLACAEMGRCILYLHRHVLQNRAVETELDNTLKNIDKKIDEEILKISESQM